MTASFTRKHPLVVALDLLSETSLVEMQSYTSFGGLARRVSYIDRSSVPGDITPGFGGFVIGCSKFPNMYVVIDPATS